MNCLLDGGRTAVALRHLRLVGSWVARLGRCVRVRVRGGRRWPRGAARRPLGGRLSLCDGEPHTQTYTPKPHLVAPMPPHGTHPCPQGDWRDRLVAAAAPAHASYQEKTKRSKATDFKAIKERDQAIVAAFIALGISATASEAAVKRGSGAVEYLLQNGLTPDASTRATEDKPVNLTEQVSAEEPEQ